MRAVNKRDWFGRTWSSTMPETNLLTFIKAQVWKNKSIDPRKDWTRYKPQHDAKNFDRVVQTDEP
jgi:hypothetical protein